MGLRATIERALAPGYGKCGMCRRPWKFAEPHITDYGGGMGCFPLCESCWAALEEPGKRLPFYAHLFHRWLAKGYPHTPEDWERIRAAVLAGG